MINCVLHKRCFTAFLHSNQHLLLFNFCFQITIFLIKFSSTVTRDMFLIHLHRLNLFKYVTLIYHFAKSYEILPNQKRYAVISEPFVLMN